MCKGCSKQCGARQTTGDSRKVAKKFGELLMGDTISNSNYLEKKKKEQQTADA